MTKDAELQALIQRWIVTFCEMPVLIDADLMRQVLADAENRETDK